MAYNREANFRAAVDNHGNILFAEIYQFDTMKKLIIGLVIFSCCFQTVSAGEEKFFSLTGEEFSYRQLVRAPKTIFLAWTVWCPYCRRELERIAQECSFFDGIEVYFINIGEKKSTVDKFAGQRGFEDCIRQRIILDTNSAIANRFKVIGIPTYIFFKDGQFLQKSYFLDQELIEEVFGPKPE